MRTIVKLVILSMALTACTKPDKWCLEWNPRYNSEECVHQREIEDKYGWTEYFWKVPLYTSLGILFIAAGVADLAGGKAGNSTVQKGNAFGPGTHMDQYGQPVTVQPVNNDPNGNYADSYIKTRDAYGPGIHMDQYGRAVKIAP